MTESVSKIVNIPLLHGRHTVSSKGLSCDQKSSAENKQYRGFREKHYDFVGRGGWDVNYDSMRQGVALLSTVHRCLFRPLYLSYHLKL